MFCFSNFSNLGFQVDLVPSPLKPHVKGKIRMKDTSKFCRMNVGYPFWEISSKNYQKYIDLKKEYTQKCNFEDEFSVWENRDINDQKTYAGCIAIVFAAIYIESEVYTYLASNLTDSFVKNHLDKLDPLSKWIVGVQVVTGKPFPKDGQAYELCKKLFSYRNRIVHHKSSPMQSNSEKTMKIIDEFEKKFDEAVHISNRTVKELAKVVRQLHDGIGKPFEFIK